ncbi:TMEM165/GDT1 family protein [Corallococcus sp. M34]|uniref:TMEM165/GDT1 family protein n=1 Tax=Citreicoccus inhibens TaxID=2849499 RepID=UPI0018F3BE24|nr:TMEM165/GDT1 family protein [Citreicoccus inhibens]MBU8897809.1 TMEM165/GDT1 family protein [Citreicoccus inhibens]
MVLESIVSSFVLVAASEMGDKTQLLAFSLASRFRRPWVVLAGIFVATVANHALASTVGAWVSSHVPARIMALILGVLFIGFGLWTLKPDTLDDEGEKASRFGPFLTTVVLFFLAEMGDKTQFATMAVAARYQMPVAVTLGTTAGMMVSDGLAVFLGEKLAGRVQMSWVRWVAAALFFIFGAVSLWTAWRAS